MPNQIKGQLYEYAKSQLGVFGSSIEIDPNVADIFANAGTRNPRKIRQFVYNFVIAYKIASVKEDEGVIAKGTVTGNTPFLAKIVVLREDWPDFFQKLEKKPVLLKRIQELIADGAQHDEYEKILENNEGLKHFLRSTGTIKSIQILPFMHLGQESFEASLPKLDRLIVGVNQNNAKYVKKIVQEDPEKQHEYVLKLCNLVEEYVENGRSMVASNALSVLVDIHGIVNEESKEKIVKLLGEFMAGNDVLDNLVMFDIDSTFSITPLLDSNTKERIYLQYAKDMSVLGDSSVILKKLIDNVHLLSSFVCDNIDNNLGSWAQTNQELFYDSTTLLKKSDAPARLIRENVLKGIISAAQSGKDKWTERYLELKHLANENVKKIFVEKMLSAIDARTGEPMSPDHGKVYETLRKMSLDDFTSDSAKHVYNVLKYPAKRYADVGDRVLAAWIILKIYTKLDFSDKKEFAIDVFASLIRQSEPQDLDSIAKIVREEGVKILEFEPTADEVFLLLQNAPSRESVDLLYSGTPQNKWQDFEEKIIRMHGANFLKVDVFASAFELSACAPERLRAKVLDKMAKSCQRFSCGERLSIYKKLSTALGSDNNLMDAFVNGLSFELSSNDSAEIGACLELTKECFGKATETKHREIFSTLLAKSRQYTAKIDLRMLEFLISKNKNMNQDEKNQFGKLVVKILRTNASFPTLKILDEFDNMEFGDREESVHEVVSKLCESSNEAIKDRAVKIVTGSSHEKDQA